MRGSSIANVRCLASTDLPILPFLAPSVFAPWPWPTSTSKRVSKRYTTAAVTDEARKTQGGTESWTRRSARSSSPELSTSRPSREAARKPEDKATRPFPSRASRSDLGVGQCLSQSYNRRTLNPAQKNQHVQAFRDARGASQYGGAPLYRDHRGRSRPQKAFEERDCDASGRPRRRTSSTPEIKRETPPNAPALHQERLKALPEVVMQRPQVRTKYVQLPRKQELGLVHSGSKYATFRSELSHFSTPWNEAFALLNAEFDKKNPEHLRQKHLIVDPRAEGWVEALLQTGFDPGSLRRSWLEFDAELRKEIWPQIIAWLLCHSPTSALHALLATWVPPYPPAYALADALEYILSHHLQSKTKYEDAIADNLLPVVYEVLDKIVESGVMPSEKTFYLLLVHSNLEQAQHLYDTLESRSLRLHWNTFLNFAYLFGRYGEYERALSALRAAVDVGANIQSNRLLSTCTQILRWSAATADGYHAGSHIVASMLQMGIRLNIQLYNVLILNAVEAGDMQTALRICELLEQNDVRPDAYTYAILLKGCKAHDDANTLRLIMRGASRVALDERSAVVATQVLHCVYLYHQRREPERAFNSLVETYLEFFDARPLCDLGVLRSTYIQEQKTKETKAMMEPSPHALKLMIAASLEYDEHVFSSWALYQRFRELCLASHPVIAPLAETDHVFNAFLKAFGSRAFTLSRCPEIIRDMSHPLLDTAMHVRERRRLVPAQPTVQTWSILMFAFLRWKQAAAAEKVLRLMKERNIEPNVVTWNTLVSGYAHMQNVEGAVGAMKRMELVGLDMDQRTMEALGWIRDREGLVRAFERAERKGDDGGGSAERAQQLVSVDATQDEPGEIEGQRQDDPVEILDLPHDAYAMVV